MARVASEQEETRAEEVDVGDLPVPPREQCGYWSCYCEENVWTMLAQLQRRELHGFHAVFVSNAARAVPIWRQKSKQGTDDPVLWDYHVLLLSHTGEGSGLVYDLDSTLPFPCPLDTYATLALRSDRDINPRYRRRLRVIPGNTFLETFASDRSHMRDSRGRWRAAPPPHPCIRTADCTMNLDAFVSMDPAVGWGDVLSLDGFLERFRA